MYFSFDSLASLSFVNQRNTLLWTEPPPTQFGFILSSDPNYFLAICSTSSVGADLDFWPFRPSCPDPSPGFIRQVSLCSVDSQKNLCNCNVYYADQGLQITIVHCWRPSCTLTVWQLALRFDSAAWCSSQHGFVFQQSHSLAVMWQIFGILHIPSTKVILVMWLPNTMTLFLQTTVYCLWSMLVNISGHLEKKTKKKNNSTYHEGC